MGLHWRPVGPLPAGTYWRRRLVLLALVVLLVLAASVLLGGDSDTADGDRPAAAPSAVTTTPATTPAATPSPEATVEACADADLEVQATTLVADVAVGAPVPLTLTVRNAASAPCRRALGQGAVELVVVSGEDRIWSSDDCAPGGDAGEVVLEPGASQAARATWPGTRSAPGCPDGQPQARPGTYRLVARVGDLLVDGMVFRVQP